MWSKVGMGGEHHRYYKHNKFRQNPRGDPKFLVELTWNDPYAYVQIEVAFKPYMLHISATHTIRYNNMEILLYAQHILSAQHSTPVKKRCNPIAKWIE